MRLALPHLPRSKKEGVSTANELHPIYRRLIEEAAKAANKL